MTRPEAHLFIPCLVEDFFPEIGEASALVLDTAGARPIHIQGQTCCGQPLFKLGHTAKVHPLAKRFIELFEQSPAIVCPSGSCAHMVRDYPALFQDDPVWFERALRVAAKTFELTEFLVSQLGVRNLDAHFPGRAVYHDSCQVGRTLGIKDQPRTLLAGVQGLEVVEPSRPDMCCGFGGPFSLQFPGVSEAILEEKAQNLLDTGADILVSAEPSCLMNIGGWLKKQGHTMRVLHIAQILATHNPHQLPESLFP